MLWTFRNCKLVNFQEIFGIFLSIKRNNYYHYLVNDCKVSQNNLYILSIQNINKKIEFILFFPSFLFTLFFSYSGATYLFKLIFYSRVFIPLIFFKFEVQWYLCNTKKRDIAKINETFISLVRIFGSLGLYQFCSRMCTL